MTSPQPSVQSTRSSTKHRQSANRRGSRSMYSRSVGSCTAASPFISQSSIKQRDFLYQTWLLKPLPSVTRDCTCNCHLRQSTALLRFGLLNRIDLFVFLSSSVFFSPSLSLSLFLISLPTSYIHKGQEKERKLVVEPVNTAILGERPVPYRRPKRCRAFG